MLGEKIKVEIKIFISTFFVFAKDIFFYIIQKIY